LSDALTAIYKLIWDDFSSWFLEWVKPAYGKPIDPKTLEATVSFFEGNLRLLHPFMPFITEEIWQHFKERSPEEALIVSSYPDQADFDGNLLKAFERVKEIVSAVRNIRKEKGISFKESLELCVLDGSNRDSGYDAAIQKLTNVSSIRRVDDKVDRSVSFRVGASEFFIPVQENIDVEAEKKKLEKELEYNKGFLRSVQKKLSNERFVNNAPEQVIANERKKEADALAKIEVLEQSIRSL
jgi:valyl-tRNA synthetase